LVAALASWAEPVLRAETRRFLLGLSSDELQFLADFLGASILESGSKRPGSRISIALRVADFQRVRCPSCSAASIDRDHKIILLREFLTRGGLRELPQPLGA
jgi:hypothetical protein